MRSPRHVDGRRSAARCCVILAISVALVATGCGRGDDATSASRTPVTATATLAVTATSPSANAAQPGGAGADEVLTIESNTQAHVGQLAIGAGNFWEEEYTPPGEAPRRGLTAGLWFTFRDAPAQNRHLRVHPGQEVEVPGYRLRILAVEPRTVRVAIRRTS